MGHPAVDEFLEFVAGRARPNTVRAYAHDLKVFFEVVDKEPAEVTPADVMAFVTAQRRPRSGAEKVVRISDGAGGLSSATIKRRLAAGSSLYGYLVIRGDAGVSANPVPRGLPTRRDRREVRGVPLVRGTRRLPRILEPAQVEALMSSLRTQRDRAMVQAMLLGALRRCEVLDLRLGDLRLGEWRVLVANGKGGHQRIVPVSRTFFATVAAYMNDERPAEATTDRLFVVLKGPRRGQPLSAEGIDEILSGGPGVDGVRTMSAQVATQLPGAPWRSLPSPTWARLETTAPEMATTMRRYLAQLGESLASSRAASTRPRRCCASSPAV